MRWMSGHVVVMWWSCQSPVAHSCNLLNHPNSFLRGMFKLNAKFGADSLLYSLSHFECEGHTVHMLTQWCLLLPLTSTVKPSLFTHAHSSPLSSAARLHRCHANCSRYINNGWTFSGQILIFWILDPRQIYDLQILFPILWIIFALSWWCSLYTTVFSFDEGQFIYCFSCWLCFWCRI